MRTVETWRPPAGATRVQLISLLGPAECASAIERVFALEPYWDPFGSDPLWPYYYTLPRPLYRSKLEIENYRARAKIMNPILWEEFGWLYQRVIRSLEEALTASVSLTREALYPGFHIYQLPMPKSGGIHYDFQYQYLRWNDQESLDFTNPLSFTLPLALPESGGGLNIWEGSCSPRNSPRYLPYAVGQMVVYRGPLLHQVAASPAMRAGERRITLQGHGLKHRGGHWFIYF